MQHGGVPELLLGLGYNGTTGRLTVEVSSDVKVSVVDRDAR